MPPDDVAAPAPAAPSQDNPAPAPADKPKPGTPELARWHGQRAQAILAKEAEQSAESESPAGTPPKDPKTGRFLKQAKQKTRADAGPGEAHNLAESGATPEPATKEAKPKPREEGQVPDSIAAIRRLANEGKWEEAFTRAFGRVPGDDLGGKGWGAWRAEAKRVKTEVEGKLRHVEQREGQLRQIHAELSAEFKPMADARKALQEGDLDKAFQLFAGTDFNTFSRNYLRQSTGPNVGKDPAVLELRKENQELRQMMQQFIGQQQETTKQQQQERARREYLDGMVAALSASDDQRIANAAKSQAFQRKVIEIQRLHYDETTDETLSHAEAAQLALDALDREREEIFGSSAPQPEPRGQSRTPPARAATPARQTARAVTTLSQKEAAEAATEPKLKGKALVEKYVRLANAQMLKQNGIG